MAAVEVSPPLSEEQRERKTATTSYPLWGRVTGLALSVRAKPDPEAPRLGWLRFGDVVHLKEERVRTATCSSGWHAVYPRGWACAGLGIDISREAVSKQARAQAGKALPYKYYFVKDIVAPEYHRLPTRKEQMYIHRFTQRYRALRDKEQDKADAFLRGELRGEELAVPPYVRRFLERGYYVAAQQEVHRGPRKFILTVRGSYIWSASVTRRSYSDFHGVELDHAHTLPIAWAVRTARPLKRIDKWDGSVRFGKIEDAEPYARQTVLPPLERETFGNKTMFRLESGNYLYPWFVARATVHPPPAKVDSDESWLHVDVAQQTLVVYRGTQPTYATLISSGLRDHPTPAGLYRVRTKRRSDTMADVGADAPGDRYRIEDVPWTQYFRGSLALHGAFWHDRFGLRRSHGCVNLAPLDAEQIFGITKPKLPIGWHGVSALTEPRVATRVLVTD